MELKTPSDSALRPNKVPSVTPGTVAIRQTLKRFHNELASASSSSLQSRFLKLNERRVAEFIDKPYTDRINEAILKAKVKEEKKRLDQPRIPGVYIYPQREELRSLIQKQNALEFDKALGDHSRFGDGDGSFFDRFVNTTSTTISRYTCDKDGFPLLGSDNEVGMGFKRHYNLAQQDKTEANRRPTVVPYEERRRLRKEAELREKVQQTVTVNIVNTDNHGGVKVDHVAGGDLRGDPSVHISSPQRGKQRTPRLPPLLTEDIKDTYFGTKGRSTFFDYYRQISRQQYLLNQRSMGPDKDLVGLLSIKDEDPERESYKADLVSKLEGMHRGVVSREGGGDGDLSSERVPGVLRFSTTPPPGDALAERFQAIVSDAGKQFEDMHLHRPDVLGSPLGSTLKGPSGSNAKGKDRGVGGGAAHTTADNNPYPSAPISARTNFIANCISNNLNPRPALIIRNQDLMEMLDISGQGVGDSLAVMLAESIPRLPLLEALNVRQNQLTEKGMLAVIQAVSRCSSLTSVDLSENKVTESAAEKIAHYLRSKNCMLELLVLQKCDLDDASVCRILEVLDSRSVKHLDLSSNRVGANETTRAVVIGEVSTAGDAFAPLLASSTCPIETLNLSWNMIRMRSAASLTTAIRSNKSLVHLDLSYNSLGDEATQILGDALHSHKTLQYLNLAHNNVCAKGCFTIVSGIKTCRTLKVVDLSDNPIGEVGSRAVMALDIAVGDEVRVLINGCLMKLAYPDCNFDPSKPTGTYDLDLTNPYSRAVCIELLRSVADNSHLSISRTVLTDNNSSTELQFTVKKRLKKLRTGRAIDMPDEMHIHQIASDINSAKKLFSQYDEDDDGVLDRYEVTNLLSSLGLATSDATVDEMMKFYDFDGGNKIGMAEFTSFLQSICDSAVSIKEWTSEQRFIVAGAPGAAVISSQDNQYSNLKEYLPPARGRIRIECVGDHKMPAFLQLASQASVNRITLAMNAVSDGESMIEHALSSMKLKFEEASKLYRGILKESGDKAKVLRRMLPRMASYTDANLMFTTASGSNVRDRLQLRRAIGDSFYMLFTGSPNGFYSLNLADECSKVSLKKLIELDAEAGYQRKKSNQGDTSQYANWSGFRNTLLDNTPVILDPEFFDKLPEKGRLEFDFVYSNCVSVAEASHAIPDERLFNLLQGLALVRKSEKQFITTRIKTLREESKGASRGLGIGFQQVDSAAAREIRTNIDDLYSKVRIRSVDADKIRIDMESKENIIFERREGGAQTHTQTTLSSSSAASLTAPRSVSGSTTPVSRSTRGAITIPDNAKFAGSELGLYSDYMSKLKNSELVDGDHYIIRLCDCVRDLLVGRLITCSQLAVLLDALATIRPLEAEEGGREAPVPAIAPVVSMAAKLSTVVKSYTGESNISVKDVLATASGTATKSVAVLNKYETARVDLVISLYTSIVDAVNIDQVMSVLSTQERAMLLFRLGYLNIWNPLKPEGCIMLNLMHREERMIVKMLIVLKNIEAGRNWKDEIYEDAATGQQARLSDLSWITDSGLPTHGTIHLRYFSGAGIGMEDCAPSPTSRMGLMSLVYAEPLREDEMATLGAKPTMEFAESTAAKGSTTYNLLEPPMQPTYVKKPDTTNTTTTTSATATS